MSEEPDVVLPEDEDFGQYDDDFSPAELAAVQQHSIALDADLVDRFVWWCMGVCATDTRGGKVDGRWHWLPGNLAAPRGTEACSHTHTPTPTSERRVMCRCGLDRMIEIGLFCCVVAQFPRDG